MVLAISRHRLPRGAHTGPEQSRAALDDAPKPNPPSGNDCPEPPWQTVAATQRGRRPSNWWIDGHDKPGMRRMGPRGAAPTFGNTRRRRRANCARRRKIHFPDSDDQGREQAGLDDKATALGHHHPHLTRNQRPNKATCMDRTARRGTFAWLRRFGALNFPILASVIRKRRIVHAGWRPDESPACRKRSSNRSLGLACGLLAGRQRLHQAVQILLPVVKGFGKNALVLAVRSNIDDVSTESRMAESRYAGIAQKRTVGGAGRHCRNHRDAWPEFRR